VAEKVRLASIGLGWWGGILADAVTTSGKGEVVTCFARTPETRQAFAEKRGFVAADSLESILQDESIDGVIIATSHESHLPLIEAVAAAGKHVFVEKPLTLTPADGRAAIDAAKAGGVLLQTGHQRRRSTANRMIKAMIDKGELGDIEMIETHQSIPNGHKMPAEAWRWNPEQSPLGGMTSLGVHKIDTMHYLAGPIKAVSAYTRPGRKTSLDETTVLAVEFESGALGTLVTSFFTPVLSKVSVFGNGGAAYMEADGRLLFKQGLNDQTREQVPFEPNDPVVEQMAAFAQAIRGEVDVETDGEVGLAAVAVLSAAIESAVTGRSVLVADHQA